MAEPTNPPDGEPLNDNISQHFRKQGFQPGHKHSPGTKPGHVGARSRHLRAIDELLNKDLFDITKKMAELAKGGDVAAARLVIERLAIPRGKPNPTPVEFGEVRTAEEAGKALASIAQQYVEGEFDGQAALIVNTLITSFLAARDQTETERRLTILENGDDDSLLRIG
jgi:hypothetical protein